MCLISKTKEPLIAEEDINCYKVVAKGKIFLASAMIGTIITEYSSSLESDILFFKEEEGYIVESEGVHVYKGKETPFNGFTLIIIPCIIPKGTKYWEGYRDMAAQHIKYILPRKYWYMRLIMWLNDAVKRRRYNRYLKKNKK